MSSADSPGQAAEAPPPVQAVVVRTTRRHVHIRDQEGRFAPARLSSKVAEVAVGDMVELQSQGGECVVSALLPRKNCLFRSYRRERRNIAANLDRLFIVTATAPLFNTAFIDRVLVFCTLQHIPCSLVLNKTDLDLAETLPLVQVYEALKMEVLYTSARGEGRLEDLRRALSDVGLATAALAGVSGVGKSTILNQLLPGAGIKTAEVSRKTGQGKRTTSQAIAHTYPRSSAPDLLLIDLPGVHAFGVSALSEREVTDGFPEFVQRRARCEYSDCCHLAEPNCAVKAAVDDDQIALSRYISYLGMIDEIRAARPY
jgi:ribosome biogenesis GTPase / thiamine phosphate phosphatase